MSTHIVKIKRMIALKVYRRQNQNQVYVLDADFNKQTDKMVYYGGSKNVSQVSTIPGAEKVEIKLHANMGKEHVWRVPVSQHDSLVQVLQMTQNGKSIEVVPKYVLELLQRPIPPMLDSTDVRERVGKNLWEVLMPFQREGVRTMVSHGGRMLCGDMCGLGKTMQALGVLAYYSDEKPALVICPACVKSSWAYHIEEYLKKEVNLIRNYKDEFDEDKINIMSFGMFGSKKFDEKMALFRPKVMIVDEAHLCKTPAAARTKKVFALSKAATRVILLTGTPCQRPIELYAQLKMIDRTLFKAIFHYQHYGNMSGMVTTLSSPKQADTFYYATRYCRPELQIKRGVRLFSMRKSENESELNAILKTHCMVRRTKAEVLPDLPVKNREKVVLDSFVLDKPLEWKDEAGMMELLRESAHKKMSHIVEYLKEIVCEELKNDPTLKVLLWAHHISILDQIEETMKNHAGCGVVRMDGRVSMKKRTALTESFQTDPNVRVAVLGISAMCTGVTLTSATLAVVCEVMFSSDAHIQSENRLHRIGQESKSCIRYLLTGPGTMDELVWRVIGSKLKSAGSTIDGKEAYMHATTHMSSDLIDIEGEISVEDLSDSVRVRKKRRLDPEETVDFGSVCF